MQPTGAQAGSQAIIDARMLTAALLDVSDPIQALCRYDRKRRPIMNDIVLRNRRLDPKECCSWWKSEHPTVLIALTT